MSRLFSISSAKPCNASATIVFRIRVGSETDIDAPGMRNSNLLPVNAKGEVRLRSEVSFSKRGRMCTPVSIFAPPTEA